ncbi:J domain-containing protein [Marinisporobacter balticus]|uniref:Molecular chaperone DnaJ n=1 Tax=Marinisporobacter balticus TaxID=2018667 RepID=A0A4R2KGH5_9FIRM|nr:DnaJ domain-containing protein [Marinisporobacter balticus]TCO71502.1 molecular chaperone DnaJ [Marinisporobacter balticus]
MKNAYKILEINTKASQNEIKTAYRKLAKKYHPDVNQNDKYTAEKFREVTEAYNILRDEKLKKEYDQKLCNEQETNQRTEQSTKTKKQAKTTNKMNVDFEFENFFGFNPRTKETKKDFGNKNKKDPMNTNDIFESFFKVKRD